jgi:hypothetical protein
MCPSLQSPKVCRSMGLNDDEAAQGECRLSKIGRFDRGKVQFSDLHDSSLVLGGSGQDQADKTAVSLGTSVRGISDTSEFQE